MGTVPGIDMCVAHAAADRPLVVTAGVFGMEGYLQVCVIWVK